MSEKFTATKRSKKALQFSSRGEMMLAKTQDFHAVFDTEAGQRVLKHLAQFGFLLRPTGGPTTSADEKDRNEGRREAVLHILEVLNYDEEAILKMILNEEDRRKNPQGDLV